VAGPFDAQGGPFRWNGREITVQGLLWSLHVFLDPVHSDVGKRGIVRAVGS